MSEPTLIKIPKFTGKLSLEELTGLETLPLADGVPFADYPSLYRGERDGMRFDYLWHPKPGATRLFVLFSGDAMRSKFDPPVFQRWKWAPYFPGHCLYVSDPSLFLHDRLGLAWYAGTQEYDPMPAIAQTIMTVASQFGVAADQIWSYGSSGGGFAALRMLDVLALAGAVCINPQTNVTVYEQGTVGYYLRTCFGGRDRESGIRDFPRRLSLLGDPARFAGRRIVYIQNRLDLHHVESHYTPFCEMMGLDPKGEAGTDTLTRILFSDPGGHGRAESSEAFSRAMAVVNPDTVTAEHNTGPRAPGRTT